MPPESWKITLPCTKAEAERLKGDIPELALLDSPPTLMTSEADARTPDQWRLDAYFDARPSSDDLAFLRKLVPSAAKIDLEVEPVAAQDWVTMSQQGLEPISAGRFFVHTPAHRGGAPAGTIAFEIDAGRAFGTGHHETTTGCLIGLDGLRRNGKNFSNILDLGTGTGLLAFAAHRLWPAARVAASDIDPIAIDVTRENADVNRVPLGRSRGQVELIVAAGMRHSRIRARGPYDMIIANILAGPLIEMAAAIAGALEPGGTLILAGLLEQQASDVRAAYRRQGMMPLSSIVRGEWPALIMRKRRRVARRR